MAEALRDQASARLAAGHLLHMQIAGGCRQWWFEQPYLSVPERTALALLADPRLAVSPAGDCLFGWPDNSQTFLQTTHEGQSHGVQ